MIPQNILFLHWKQILFPHKYWCGKYFTEKLACSACSWSKRWRSNLKNIFFFSNRTNRYSIQSDGFFQNSHAIPNYCNAFHSWLGTNQVGPNGAAFEFQSLLKNGDISVDKLPWVVKELFSQFFAFFAKNGSIFFAFREKFKTRKMCSTLVLQKVSVHLTKISE